MTGKVVAAMTAYLIEQVPILVPDTPSDPTAKAPISKTPDKNQPFSPYKKDTVIQNPYDYPSFGNSTGCSYQQSH